MWRYTRNRPLITTDFGDVIAGRMRVEHQALAGRWFSRLLDLLPVDARDVFPSRSLLDHIPALILELSGLNFCAAAGFATLHTIDRRCTQMVCWAVVPSAPVSRLLQLCDPHARCPPQPALMPRCNGRCCRVCIASVGI